MSLEKALRDLLNTHSRGQIEIIRGTAVGEAVKYMTGAEALLWYAKCMEDTCNRMDLADAEIRGVTVQ